MTVRASKVYVIIPNDETTKDRLGATLKRKVS